MRLLTRQITSIEIFSRAVSFEEMAFQRSCFLQPVLEHALLSGLGYDMGRRQIVCLS